jgi:hypothetical protein
MDDEAVAFDELFPAVSSDEARYMQIEILIELAQPLHQVDE